MKKSEIEVVRFGAEDVIVTSAAPKLVTWSNLGGSKMDSIVNFNGENYGWREIKNNSMLTAASDLLKYYGYTVDGVDAKDITLFSNNGGISNAAFHSLFNDEGGLDDYNESYTFHNYDGNYYWFYKQ